MWSRLLKGLALTHIHRQYKHRSTTNTPNTYLWPPLGTELHQCHLQTVNGYISTALARFSSLFIRMWETIKSQMVHVFVKEKVKLDRPVWLSPQILLLPFFLFLANQKLICTPGSESHITFESPDHRRKEQPLHLNTVMLSLVYNLFFVTI